MCGIAFIIPGFPAVVNETAGCQIAALDTSASAMVQYGTEPDSAAVRRPHEKKEQQAMAKQHWKGSVLLAPVPPTLVSCGTMEHPNVLTIAWTGVLATHPPMTYISVRPSR